MVLTSVDEHCMADVEVKIKLGHDTARSILYGLLADFPIPAIMENVSLIRTVLDVVGGSHSHGVADNGKGLDSIAAMGWLERLLSGAVSAFSVYLNGSICSYNSDENIVTNDEEPQAGLATNITSAIARMRFPAVSDTAHQGKGLSISGLAFACAAASMPLMGTTDPDLLCACISLLQISLPLLKEPTESTDRKTRVEIMRLQHLFNRVDGLLDTDQGYASSLVAMTTALRGGDGGDGVTMSTRGVGLLSLLTKLLAMIPAGEVYPANITVAKTQATKISLCPNTVAAVRELCAHARTVTPLFASEAEIKSIWSVLQALDSAAHDSILRAQNLVMCAKSMQYASYSDPVDALLEKLSSSIQILETATENEGGAHEDYHCIEYALGLYLAMAASGSDSRDASFQQAMELVARILTHSTPAFRVMCVKQLRGLVEGYLPDWTCELFVNFGITGDKLLAIEVQTMLLQPWLVEAIIMGSVYAVNCPQEMDKADRAALSDPAFDLLGSLLISLGEEHTSRIFQVAPSEWSRLLFPLTLMEWGVEGMDFEFVPKSIHAFRNLLELFCYSSDSGTSAKNAYYMISVYGLFHSSDIVRKRSASLLGSAETYDWDSRTAYSTWDALASTQRKKEKFAGRSAEYHSGVDVTKIAKLAFGLSSATANFAALRQLRSICADLNPAPAAEPDWCVAIGASAMDEITSFYYQVRDNEIVGIYETRDLQACVESLLIVRSLVSKSSRVRADVDIKLQSTDSDIPFAMLLDLACIPEGDAEDSEMIATVQILSKQLLALYAVGKVGSEGMAGASMGSSTEAGSMGYSILNVSRDLAITFSFPELDTDTENGGVSVGEYSDQISAKDTMDGLVYIDLCSLRYGQGTFGGGMVPVASQDLECVKAAAALPPIDTLLHECADAFAAQISQAEDSGSFVAAMDVGRALMLAVPMIALFFARKDLDVVCRRTAGSPRQVDELSGLNKGMQFLSAVLKATHMTIGTSECVEGPAGAKSSSGAVKDLIVQEVIERGENGELGYLYESVGKCIRTSLPTLVYDSSAVSPMLDAEVLEFKTLKGPVRSPRSKPEAAFSAHRDTTLYHLTSLHHSLLSYAASSSAAKEIMGNELMTDSLQELAFDKSKDPWLRRAVLEVIRTSFSSVANGTQSMSSTGPQTAKWKALIETARVLRKPDSFQGYGVLISSMKAISTGLSNGTLSVNDFCDGDESTEPKWLVRLLYDRRAEVRLVALECVASVPSFRHSRALGEVLVALAADGSECAAVTHLALKILLSATFGETRSQIIGEFLCKAEEALTATKPTVSFSSISLALSALLKLLLSPSSKASALGIVESLQLLPLLMRISTEGFQESVTKLAYSRVGLTLTSANVLPSSQGWHDALQNATGVQARQAWASASICGFRIILALERENPKAFQECAARCKFADHLVACIASPFYDIIAVPPSAEAKARWLSINEAESRSFAALCEVMCVALSVIEEKSTLRRHASVLCEALPTCILVQAERVRVVASVRNVAARADYCRAALAPMLRMVCLALDASPSSVNSQPFVEALLELRESVALITGGKQAEFSRVNSQIAVALAVLLQNTGATMSPELLQEYFTSVASSVKDFQSALEADAVRASKHSHAAGNSPSTKADTTGLRRIIYALWSSLLVVKSAFHRHSKLARGLAEFSGLHEGIDVLLARCVALSGNNGVHGGRILLALLADHPSSDGGWTPNFSHLCSASLAVWCSLCAGDNASKGLMLKGLTLGGSDGRYKSNNLTHVTTLGTSNSVGPAVNQVSLALLSSAMSCAFSSRDEGMGKAPIISRIAAQTSMTELNMSLQEALKRGQREDVAGTVAMLIDAIGSCVALEGIQGEKKTKALSPGAGLRSQSPTVMHASNKDRFPGDNKATAEAESSLDPALLASIREDYKSNAAVANAIVRFLGKQAATKMFLLDGCNDLLPRRLMSKANSVECMNILTENMTSGHPVNAEVTSIVLWTLIHGSEQARAHYKQSVTPSAVENQLNGANGRANFGLRNLLA